MFTTMRFARRAAFAALLVGSLGSIGVELDATGAATAGLAHHPARSALMVINPQPLPAEHTVVRVINPQPLPPDRSPVV